MLSDCGGKATAKRTGCHGGELSKTEKLAEAPALGSDVTDVLLKCVKISGAEENKRIGLIEM